MEQIIGALFPLTFVAFLVVERVFPARPLPKVKRWLLKGVVFFFLSAFIGGVIPTFVTNAIAPHAPLHVARFGTVLGALVAFVVSDAVSYGVHRLMHNVPWLWRWTHQMHHSAERLDVAGAVYFHPLDIALQSTTPAIVAGLLGISPAAAALAGYAGFVLAMFQHLNVRTPQWLGWIVQRPEAHAVHHARGVHAYNYGNLTLWDIVLGTFRNPASFPTEPAGFWDGASSKVGAMLIGRDVAEPAPAPTWDRPPRSSTVSV
jgi:sterol desaturase/sphingolipid hydroxylase (fatty acid hydroxylase superfamily)